MDSNTAVLVKAASGLERLMAGSSAGAILKDSSVAQISAAIYYQSKVVSKLTTSKPFESKFTKIIFDQINKDFGEYVDSLARSKPKSLHHVYEWKKVGNKSGRLFKLSRSSQEGLSFKIDYSFNDSKSAVPLSFGKRRHVFAMKASVMEAGNPLIIAPRHSERLVFNVGDSVVFMPKGASVTVKRPGGPGVKNQFSLAYSRFFSGQLVNSSIKRSGFQQVFNMGMTKALKLPADIKKVKYSFSANTVDMQAEAAIAAAFGGAL